MKFKRLICGFLDAYVQGGIILGLFYLIGQYLKIEVFEVAACISWGVILSKDIMGGQSISKKLLGLQIVDRRTTLAPKSLITILRNAIALPIFPFEVFFYLLFDRRIGDLIFKTQVVSTPRKRFSQIGEEIKSMPFKNIVIYLGIGVGLAFLGLMIYMNIFFLAFKTMNKN